MANEREKARFRGRVVGLCTDQDGSYGRNVESKVSTVRSREGPRSLGTLIVPS